MFIYLTNDENSVLETYDNNGVLINAVNVNAATTKAWMESIQLSLLTSSVSIPDIGDGCILLISTNNVLEVDAAPYINDLPSDVILELTSLISNI